MILLDFIISNLEYFTNLLPILLSLFIFYWSFNRFNVKDRKDLDIRLIEKSLEDVKELKNLLKQTTSDSTDFEDRKKYLDDFTLQLEHICILILSGTVQEHVLKYRYNTTIKTLVEGSFIEKIHQILDIPFNSEDYQYLEDTYLLICKNNNKLLYSFKKLKSWFVKKNKK